MMVINCRIIYLTCLTGYITQSCTRYNYIFLYKYILSDCPHTIIVIYSLIVACQLSCQNFYSDSLFCVACMVTSHFFFTLSNYSFLLKGLDWNFRHMFIRMWVMVTQKGDNPIIFISELLTCRQAIHMLILVFVWLFLSGCLFPVWLFS